MTCLWELATVDIRIRPRLHHHFDLGIPWPFSARAPDVSHDMLPDLRIDCLISLVGVCGAAGVHEEEGFC
jgi:hypothetical protein